MFKTDRNPFDQAVNALNRGADAGAQVPVRQQERADLQQQREDVQQQREDVLTDDARQTRMDMLAELYEARALLDPDDPEDLEAMQQADELIQELLGELDLTGREAIRSLGQGSISFRDRNAPPTTSDAEVTTGRGATIEGTGQSLDPRATVNVAPRREIPSGVALGNVKTQGARAERRREVEQQERVFEHDEFMTRLGFNLEGISREDQQEFESLMAQAQREHEQGQLTRQVKASLRELVTRIDADVNMAEFDAELQKYLQEQAQQHAVDIHGLQVDADTNIRVEERLWTMATGLFDNGTEEAQAEITRFQGMLNGALARGEITPLQAENLAFQASTKTGLKKEAFLTAEADREFSQFRATAAEHGVALSELEVGRERFSTAQEIKEAAFNAAQSGNFVGLQQIEFIATQGEALGYTPEQVAAAQGVMEDMPLLEETARGVFEDTTELRRLALDNAKLAYDNGQLTLSEARIAFAQQIAGTFETLEEAEAYLTNLPRTQQGSLHLDTPEGREAFLGAVDYAMVIREQGYWGQRVSTMSGVPVDSDEWGDQFMFALEMAGLDGEDNAGVRAQITEGYRRVARNEDDELEARISQLNAQAELARASARKGGGGGEAFKAAVDGLNTLLDSVADVRQQACEPTNAMGEENPKFDQAACDLATESEQYWQTALQDLLASNGVVFREVDGGDGEITEDDIRGAVDQGATHAQFPPGVWTDFPTLEEELFPDIVQERRRSGAPRARSAGSVVGQNIDNLNEQNRAVASGFQGAGRFFTGSSNPTMLDRDRWNEYVEDNEIGPLISNYTRATRDGDAAAEQRATNAIFELGGTLRIRPDVLQSLLREYIGTISPSVNNFPILDLGPGAQ